MTHPQHPGNPETPSSGTPWAAEQDPLPGTGRGGTVPPAARAGQAPWGGPGTDGAASPAPDAADSLAGATGTSDGGPDPQPAEAADAGTGVQVLGTPDSGTEEGNTELLLGPWLRQVEEYTGPDALLDFNLVDNVHIDLTAANPSGYAQLLAGRRTRLSTLLRERTQLSAGMRAAQAIRAKTFELDALHGLSAGFLAAGTASWLVHDPRTGAEKRHIAPIVLAPLAINPHPAGDDFELRLQGRARLNPALVRHLRRESGIDLLALGTDRKITSGSRLTPEPVFEAVRAACQEVRGMHVESTTVVSTFADLSDTVGELPSHASSGLLRELSDLHRAEVGAPRTPRSLRTQPVSSDAVDPAEEVLVHDADESVSQILQLARAGESLAVTAPAGTAPLTAAISVVAALAAQGRSVMVLAERRETLRTAVARLRELGLGDLVLEPGEEQDPAELSRELVEAIVAHENAEAPRLGPLHEELRTTRARLAEHVESLHWQEDRWGVSPYRAMQTLAQLTAREPAPATRVRFKRAVLDATVDRTETVAQLERAAELKAFSKAAQASPWYGARLVSAEETQQARALVRHLLQTTRDLGRRLQVSLDGIGLRRGETLGEWREQLTLLRGIRESLTRFSPEVYDHPATDLIAATASSAWRRERGIEMSAMQRSRLRRTAKEHILPQVHITDLHQALETVQSQREDWQAWAADHRVVSVPEDLDELSRILEELLQELSALEIVMEDSPARRDYPNLPLPELLQTLEAMAGERFLLDTLPERDRLLSILRGKGLQDLLQDLEEREVPARRVRDELELAWWQSAFEIMLNNPEVNLVSGQRLSAWESAYRRADVAHVASGPARVRHGVAEGWRRRIDRSPAQAKELRRLLKGAPRPLRTYLEDAPEILAGLKPIWCLSPFAVGRTLPIGARVDAVVVLDAEATPLGACLAALARTDQVISFGDVHAGFPQPFVVSPSAGAEQGTSTAPVDSAQEVLEQILPCRTLTRVGDARDQVLLEHLNRTRYGGVLEALPYGEELVGPVRSLKVDHLHETRAEDRVGAPVVDSPSAEVRAVVEMVFDHAARNPQQSLVVLTASPRHAARIAEGVRYGLGRHPELEEFFRPGREPFRVLDLARATGVRRDRVIFSLGVASQAGSRPEHFGQLADAHGRQRFVAAMTAARYHTRIVTSLTVEQLRAAELREGMEDLVELVERHAAARAAEEAEGRSERTAEAGAPRAARSPGAGAERSSFLAVYDAREEEEAADWLLADLARRLRQNDAEVALAPGEHVDLVAVSDRESLSAGAIPSPRARTAGHGTRGMAAGDEPLRFPVGMTSDGTQRYAALSVRERSRLRPERLERHGWNHVPVWAVDVFADPQSVAARVLACLGLETEEPQDAAAGQEKGSGPSGPEGRTPGPGKVRENASPAASASDPLDGDLPATLDEEW